MYTKEIKLNDNEIAGRINVETGEVTPLAPRPNNVPKGKEVFEPNAKFTKTYGKTWEFLKDKLTPLEFRCAFTLSLMAKMNTNSLEPLNDNTCVIELMEILDISKNNVTPILKKLFNLGVYGKFEVKDSDKPYTKYWVLNPYLSFSGKVIDTALKDMFRNTLIGKAYYS
jgi:hypothetical protein